MIEPGQNTGFIAVSPKLGDFVAGAETGVLSTPVLPSCDWRPYLPMNVTQLMKRSDGTSIGDTNACVSFAGKQSVETQLNFQIESGKVSAENVAWLRDNGYIDASGSILLSARFTAKMSGTTPANGNSLPAVWGSLKNDGCVPEGLWPMPNFDSASTQSDGWNIYYRPVPQQLIDLGKQFAVRFPVLYEWLVYPGVPAAGNQLRQDLAVSPLEIGTAVCPGWNTDDPIHACGPGTQHATLLIEVEPSGLYDILDHYVPWIKQFAGDYTITYGMRGVVGQALPPLTVSFHYTFTKQLTFGGVSNDSTELHAMQQALQYLKDSTATPYMKAGVFGPFGPQTKAALGRWQTDNGISDPNGQGVDFGPRSRAVMNAALFANK